MDNDRQKWKASLHKMSGYQAPDNQDLFWKIQLNDLPTYTTNKAFDFSDTPTSKTKTKRISWVIFAILIVLLLVSIITIIYNASNKEIVKPLENITLDIDEDDLMDKTFESFCHDFHIECDDLYDTDIAQRWNNNQKSYQMTLAAIAQVGESDFLNRQLTYLRLDQTEMVSEIINNI
ncbi:MAG TPA: hypothetical protein VK169_10005 [Saprospiraceae bacterium]|nr:hypothetical protein [Saprospiraceae bacterium]